MRIQDGDSHSLTQPNIQKSEYKEEIEIDHEWVERIGKIAYDLAISRIHNNDFIVKSSDSKLLGCIGLAIKQHLDALPPNLHMTFQQLLDDIKAKKDGLERQKEERCLLLLVCQNGKQVLIQRVGTS